MTLLGIDAGLTNVKAALFDTDGTELAVAVRGTPGVSPEPGYAEQDLDALWEAVADAIGEVAGEGSRIDGVGVAGHGHGLYALDADGSPARNGIKSTDDRALDLLAAWEDDGTLDAVAAVTGYEPFGADPLSLLAWLKREEPASYDRIDRILFCKDYLTYRLTGRVCTDPMEASSLFDLGAGEYATGLLERLEIGEVADALPEVVPSGETCGRVTDAAAADTGLEPGTPVASGLHDVGATALGAGVHEPGQGMLIVGTWGQSIAIMDGPRADAPVGLTRQFLPGRWLRYKGNRSAAASLDWFLETCCPDWDAYERANRAVENAPVGAGGLLFHPYLHGSTDDPTARGGFYGLSADHDRSHLLRAIYEGVAMAQVERLRELLPGDLDAVHMGGGGARSPVWTGVFADVLGDSITVPDGSEPGARGAAMCAGVATGAYADFADAVDAAVGVDREHEPDPGNAAIYRELRDVFEAATDDVAPTWERLRALREGR